MKNMIYWLFPIGWMGVIFFSSATPYEQQDMKPILKNVDFLTFLEPIVNKVTFTYHGSIVSVNSLGLQGLVEFFIRKGAHIFAFFILLCLLYFALSKTTKLSLCRRIMFSLFLSIAYAITDEIHQGFTPNRTPYIGDVIIDTVGALIAAGFIVGVLKRRKEIN